MVPDASRSTPTERSTSKSGSSTLVNAFIGGVAGVVLSFVPFSTLLGGAIAGYLEGGTTNDGLKVGALAGVVMLIPFALIGLFVVTAFFGFAAGPGGAPLAFGLLFIVVLVVGVLYTVGLSALGGYLGIYLKDEL